MQEINCALLLDTIYIIFCTYQIIISVFWLRIIAGPHESQVSAFLWLLWRFPFLFFFFSGCSVICQHAFFFGFVFLGVCRAWICGLITFNSFLAFSATFLKSSSWSSRTLITRMSDAFLFYHMQYVSCAFLCTSHLFFSLLQSGYFLLIHFVFIHFLCCI